MNDSFGPDAGFHRRACRDLSINDDLPSPASFFSEKMKLATRPRNYVVPERSAIIVRLGARYRGPGETRFDIALLVAKKSRLIITGPKKNHGGSWFRSRRYLKLRTHFVSHLGSVTVTCYLAMGRDGIKYIASG